MRSLLFGMLAEFGDLFKGFPDEGGLIPCPESRCPVDGQENRERLDR